VQAIDKQKECLQEEQFMDKSLKKSVWKWEQDVPDGGFIVTQFGLAFLPDPSVPSDLEEPLVVARI
jgi:hypothetical protein